MEDGWPRGLEARVRGIDDPNEAFTACIDAIDGAVEDMIFKKADILETYPAALPTNASRRDPGYSVLLLPENARMLPPGLRDYADVAAKADELAAAHSGGRPEVAAERIAQFARAKLLRSRLARVASEGAAEGKAADAAYAPARLYSLMALLRARDNPIVRRMHLVHHDTADRGPARDDRCTYSAHLYLGYVHEHGAVPNSFETEALSDALSPDDGDEEAGRAPGPLRTRRAPGDAHYHRLTAADVRTRLAREAAGTGGDAAKTFERWVAAAARGEKAAAADETALRNLKISMQKRMAGVAAAPTLRALGVLDAWAAAVRRAREKLPLDAGDKPTAAVDFLAGGVRRLADNGLTADYIATYVAHFFGRGAPRKADFEGAAALSFRALGDARTGGSHPAGTAALAALLKALPVEGAEPDPGQRVACDDPLLWCIAKEAARDARRAAAAVADSDPLEVLLLGRPPEPGRQRIVGAELLMATINECWPGIRRFVAAYHVHARRGTLDGEVRVFAGERPVSDAAVYGRLLMTGVFNRRGNLRSKYRRELSAAHAAEAGEVEAAYRSGWLSYLGTHWAAAATSSKSRGSGESDDGASGEVDDDSDADDGSAGTGDAGGELGKRRAAAAAGAATASFRVLQGRSDRLPVSLRRVVDAVGGPERFTGHPPHTLRARAKRDGRRYPGLFAVYQHLLSMGTPFHPDGTPTDETRAALREYGDAGGDEGAALVALRDEFEARVLKPLRAAIVQEPGDWGPVDYYAVETGSGSSARGRVVARHSRGDGEGAAAGAASAAASSAGGGGRGDGGDDGGDDDDDSAGAPPLPPRDERWRGRRYNVRGRAKGRRRA